MERKELGRYIVADPDICHGKPTFRGTRIMVWQVLEMLADGMDWDTIVEKWSGYVPREAIPEALMLASKAFIAQTQPDEAEPAVAQGEVIFPKEVVGVNRHHRHGRCKVGASR